MKRSLGIKPERGQHLYVLQDSTGRIKIGRSGTEIEVKHGPEQLRCVRCGCYQPAAQVARFGADYPATV